jgi:DNA polymerase III subunit delta'
MAKRPTKPALRKPLADASLDSLSAPPALRPAVPPPIPLGSVLGQSRAIEVLLDTVRSGRVHHAWIFQGPQGVGKCTAALAFAALILDSTTSPTLGGEIAPDPDSKIASLLQSGSHPDLHLVTKELAAYHDDAGVRSRKQLSISVDVVRQFVLDPGALAATIASNGALASKVFVIDQAELLNVAAQNAMLKFLEEPPERTVLILVCNNPEELLPTIRSRCQRVGFATLDDRALKTCVPRAGMTLERGDEWLLDFCAGSPGDLILAKQTGIAGWWATLAPHLEVALRGKHSVELGGLMAQLVDDWAKAWVEERELASKEAANRAAAAWMFRLMAWQLRAKLSTPELATKAIAALECVRLGEEQLDRNVSSLFVFESIASGVAACMDGSPSAFARV